MFVIFRQAFKSETPLQYFFLIKYKKYKRQEAVSFTSVLSILFENLFHSFI